MAKRKGSPPPFEVMRGTVNAPREEALPPVEAPPGYDGPGAPQGAAPSAPEDWLGRLKHPVVLRLPRGYIAVAAAAFIGLIVLAYFVGHRQGERVGNERATARAEQKAKEALGLGRVEPIPAIVPPDPPGHYAGRNGAPGGNGGAAGNGGRTPPGPGNGGNGTITPHPPAGAWPPDDIRVPGLNYMLLATWPKDEARRLTAFFAEHGVATTATPVGGTGLYAVYAVDNGFSKATIRSPEANGYEERLRLLGRAWKKQNNNRGDDLSDMYWDKHEGS